jgi:hypothetical protein
MRRASVTESLVYLALVTAILVGTWIEFVKPGWPKLAAVFGW